MGCGGSKSTSAVVVSDINQTNNNNIGFGQPSTQTEKTPLIAPATNNNQPQQSQDQQKQQASATRITKKVQISDSDEPQFFDILSYEEAAKQVSVRHAYISLGCELWQQQPYEYYDYSRATEWNK